MFLENLRLKLRYILWPYGRMLVVLTLAVAGVNAVLFAYLPLFEPPFWLWSVVGPIGLSILAVWRLWPSLALIKAVKLGRSDLREVVVATTFGLLALMAGFLPSLVKATVSPALRLAAITRVSKAPAARYYQVPQLLADTQQAGWEETQETRKGTVYYTLFVVCPVWADTARHQAPVAWLGFRYATSHAYADTGTAAAVAFTQFRQACKLALPTENDRPFDHLERCPNTEDQAYFRQAMQYSPGYREAAAPPLLLLPVATSLANLAQNSLYELGAIQLIGSAFFVLLVLVSPLSATRKLALTSYSPRRH